MFHVVICIRCFYRGYPCERLDGRVSGNDRQKVCLSVHVHISYSIHIYILLIFIICIK